MAAGGPLKPGFGCRACFGAIRLCPSTRRLFAMRRNDRLPSIKSLLRIALSLSILTSGSLAQTKFTVLYNFRGVPDAASPWAAVTLGSNDTLYGTTAGGGTGSCGGGCGTVFRLTRQANGKWTETILQDFQDDFEALLGGLVRDSSGNFFGTSTGGNLLFELTANGDWNEYPLPLGGSAAPLLDRGGKLFEASGDIFEITATSDGWMQKDIYSFHPQSGKDGTDGSAPAGSLISDGHGNLYGATEFGGNYSLCSGSSGCGTVFKLTPNPDGTWTEHVLHRFAQFQNDGQLPFAGVIMDAAGNLYGTTYEGGQYDAGTVFRLSPGSDGRWHESILHNFSGREGAASPNTGLTLDRSGNLYGVSGGTVGGAVFELTPGTDGKWTFSVLHEFTGSDGYLPQSSLTLDSRGNLYGTTLFGGKYRYGVVFELRP